MRIVCADISNIPLPTEEHPQCLSAMTVLACNGIALVTQTYETRIELATADQPILARLSS